MIGQGWWQDEWEGLRRKRPDSSMEYLDIFPLPLILNNILLLKILFSEIYRSPEGQQFPFYPPGLEEGAIVHNDF